VAIDVSAEPLAPLERYLDRAGLGQQVLTRYGVDQGNRQALDAVLARDLGATPLDLVVDDASHQLHATRESFNALFPRLTPGGLYFIEDWGWAHWPGEWQANPPYFAGQPSLSNLIVQIVFAAASRPEAIAEVVIDGNTVAVRRGPAPLEPTFDIRTAHLARGRHWTPL
jgi:predicted O-methyltransferase YrrM